MARLLVFTPTYADALRVECRASVTAQTFAGEWRWEVSRHNPYPVGDLRNVTAQYQRARDMALDGGYDALLTVEHDMVLPAGAIQRLYDTDAPVVYGVYLLRHGTRLLNAWRYENERNLGMNLSRYPRELAQYRAAGVGPVSGIGFGCTLIRRAVLERISFRDDPDGGACDIPFARDCISSRTRQLARFDVACGHIEGERVLWPYEDGAEDVTEVVVQQDVTILSDGGTRRLVTGQMVALPQEQAQELARAGYVRLVEPVESPKRRKKPESHAS